MFGDLAKKFIPKIQCLLHLINRDTLKGGYQLNAENHIWFFGLKDGEFATITNRLLDNNIIKISLNHISGEVSRIYKMVNQYTQQDSNKHVYKPDAFLFIEKFVADDFIVKSKKYSTFTKTPKSKVAKVQDDKDLQIEFLKARVKELEDTINAHGLIIAPCAIKSPTEPLNIPVVQAQPIPIKEPVMIDKDEKVVDYFQGTFDMSFTGYKTFEVLTFGLTRDQKIDINFELIQNINEKPVNNFEIQVKDKRLSFFSNRTDTTKPAYLLLENIAA